MNWLRRVTTCAILGVCAASELDAQVAATSSAPSVPQLRAARRDGPIVLDGRLDEAAWQKADVARQFEQSWPNPGKPASEPMEVRVLYDDDALYVGVRLFDAHPDSIAAQLARRDATGIYSDWVHLIIDSYHDRRTAFRFTVNPKGVQKDVYTSNDNQEDTNWDAVWDVATRIDSVGWVAEYRIPLSQLRFGDAPPNAERVWGFQVQRDIARRNERDTFAAWQPDGTGFVSRFGDLTGLINIPQPERLEVLPYASTKVTRAPGSSTNPFYKKTDTKPNAGADVRYGLPGGLTLTATLNPDFGQVEVDPAVVNLTAFETFFPEKRPFFLEGSDVFSFGQVRRMNDYGGQTFFYTRRIGRAPQRRPGGSAIQYVDMPDATTIAGAAKVTGRKGPWTIGILDALTSEEKATVAGPTGLVDSTTAVEPLTNYFAGRARRDYRSGQTVFGSMVSLVNRNQSPLFANILSASAGFGGVDFEHRWSKGQYVLSGFVLGSRVNGSAAVIDRLQRSPAHYFQRPDATRLVYDPARTSLTGEYSEVAIQKNGDWIGSLAIKDVSPTFEINDIGFHGRVDYRAVSPFWGYQSNQKDSWSQNKFAGVWSNHVWNYDGLSIYQGYGGSANATFNSLWGAGIGGNLSPSFYSDRLLRGGPVAKTPGSYSVNAWLASDSRRPISINPFVYYRRNSGDPAWISELDFFVDMRPSTTVHVTFGPSYIKEYSTSQYIQRESDVTSPTYQSRYVLANLNQTTLSLDTRIDWTFTSKLSMQTYIQPFVSVGRYADFKEFTTPGAFNFAVYGRDRGSIRDSTDTDGFLHHLVDPGAGGAQFVIDDPNFHSHSLRGNAVLRWEYRPGSTLFFVWQQTRSGDRSEFDFETGRDVGAIFRDRPTNTFLIKAAYWLSR